MDYWREMVNTYEKKLKGNNDDSWGPPKPVEPLIEYMFPDKPSYEIEETKSEESGRQIKRERKAKYMKQIDKIVFSTDPK